MYISAAIIIIIIIIIVVVVFVVVVVGGGGGWKQTNLRSGIFQAVLTAVYYNWISSI